MIFFEENAHCRILVGSRRRSRSALQLLLPRRTFMPCAPRLGRQLLCFVMVISGLFCQVLAASAQDYVRQVGLPQSFPDAIAPDRFVVQFKSQVAHGLLMRAEPAGPRASLPAVQRALDK